jgi:hypothetical protein
MDATQVRVGQEKTARQAFSSKTPFEQDIFTLHHPASSYILTIRRK